MKVVKELSRIHGLFLPLGHDPSNPEPTPLINDQSKLIFFLGPRVKPLTPIRTHIGKFWGYGLQRSNILVVNPLAFITDGTFEIFGHVKDPFGNPPSLE